MSEGVSARCPTPATQKRRRPRDTGGMPGRTSDPLAMHIVPRLLRKSGRDQGTPEGTGGTPGRTSDPLAVHIVPRLPRKSGGDQGTPEEHRRDAKAYIRPLGSAHCPTPATQKRRRRRDTGGTPEGHRRDTGGTPEGHRMDTGGTPEGHQRDTGGTPEGHRRDTGGGTPGRTSDPLAHCPTPATQKRRRPRDTGGTPEGRQGVHPTPWQCTLSRACHAKAAETKGHRRNTGGTPGRTSDPLAVHIVPRLPRKSGGDQGTPEEHRRDAKAYIRPLGSADCPTPATQKRRRPRDTGGTPEGRQGVHPTPWQCTLSHACYAKAAETKGHRRDTGGIPKHPIITHAQAHPKQLGATVTLRQKKNDKPTPIATAARVPFIVACSHFTRKNIRFRAPASSPKQSPCNIMQPFQCDLLPQLQETHRTTHTRTTTRCKTHRRNNSRQKRPQPHPPHRRGTFHRQNRAHATSCSHSNTICYHSFKKRIELRTHEQPLVAKRIGGAIRDRKDPSRTRRTDEVPFIAGCSHFTRKNTRFRAPASSPKQSPCIIMQPFQCDLQPQLQETHRTTHTRTTTHCKTHRRNSSRQKRPQPHPPHRRGTFHRRLQPLYTEKHKVSCSGFLPKT